MIRQRRMSSCRSRPTLILKMFQPRARFAAQLPELVVGIAEPAGRRGVGREALALQMGDPFGPRRFQPFQHRQRFVRRQGVGDVAEIDAPHHVFRRHLAQHPPQRLAGAAWREDPSRIDDGPPVERWITPFSGPIQRSWLSPVICRPEAPKSAIDFFQRPADKERRQRLNAGDAQFVAAADGEGQPVTGERRVGPVGPRIRVRRRVIRPCSWRRSRPATGRWESGDRA